MVPAAGGTLAGAGSSAGSQGLWGARGRQQSVRQAAGCGAGSGTRGGQWDVGQAAG